MMDKTTCIRCGGRMGLLDRDSLQKGSPGWRLRGTPTTTTWTFIWRSRRGQTIPGSRRSGVPYVGAAMRGMMPDALPAAPDADDETDTLIF